MSALNAGTPLTRGDLEYLEGLVRREIAKKQTDLRTFKKRNGQTIESACAAKLRLAEGVEYRRRVLDRLQATWGRPK